MAEQTAREAALQAEQARIEKQYQEAVASAEQLFNLQQYSGSIEGYRNALKIKPGEPYPAQRIAEAEAIMAELTATQKAYNEAIATADKAFRQQQYRQARKGYEDALKIKSSEKYPEEMLDKIDAIEEEMMRLAEEKNRLEEEKKPENKQHAKPPKLKGFVWPKRRHGLRPRNWPKNRQHAKPPKPKRHAAKLKGSPAKKPPGWRLRQRRRNGTTKQWPSPMIFSTGNSMPGPSPNIGMH